MGVTTHSNNLVQKHKGNAKTMLELGSQNTYFDSQAMGVAKPYYQSQGFEHVSVDLNAEYGSIAKDLSQLHDLGQFDLVTDFGTSEHVPDFYMCWLNKHKACKIGGLIISENPKVDNWHGHGYHYVTKDFYIELAKVAGYEIVELGEHAAMGNVTDGWNVYCVLRKTSEQFPTGVEFYSLPHFSVQLGIPTYAAELIDPKNIVNIEQIQDEVNSDSIETIKAMNAKTDNPAPTIQDVVELVKNSPPIPSAPNDPAMDNWIKPEKPAPKAKRKYTRKAK